MNWTKGDDAELLRMWPNHSAEKIAAKLGVTRNAVIGRYHRIAGHYRSYQPPTESERKRKELKKADRKQAIKDALDSGKSQSQVARMLKVSRQRIHQMIALDFGVESLT
jgi:hypothetical protein